MGTKQKFLDITQTALLAKEKGFLPKTFTTNWTNNFYIGEGKDFKINETCVSLLLFEIQNWLRDTYDIHIMIKPWEGTEYQCFVLYNKVPFDPYDESYIAEDTYSDYDESLNAGILESLEILNDKKYMAKYLHV